MDIPLTSTDSFQRIVIIFNQKMATLDLRSSSSLSVLSCAKKLYIENFAAFGDAEDILNDKVIKSDGGTIIFTIDVRRQFMPGNLATT